MKTANIARPTGRKVVLGLTGGVGSGKTTIAGFFKSFGASVVDADQIARQLLRPGTQVYQKVLAVFGGKVVKRGKNIDRNALANIVFSDRAARVKLNRILHPEVISRIRRKIGSARGLIVVDAPLLFESGLARFCDLNVVVNLSRGRQLTRLARKRGINAGRAKRIIGAQMPLAQKLKKADIIIDNNKTVFEAKKQVKELIRRRKWKELISVN